MEWVLVDGYMAYKDCATAREYHDINAEYGYGYNYFLHYQYYAQLRWAYRGEG
jgi:hypothetical protein